MSEEITDIPIHQNILSSMREATLFVNINGKIIKGNEHAHLLLNHNPEFNIPIDHYLDFAFIKSAADSDLLMELRNVPNTWLEVNRIKINDSLYCLILHSRSIVGKSTEFKSFHDSFDTANIEKDAKKSIQENHHYNYKFFDSSISDHIKSMLAKESELRKALKKNQFEIHYQPQKNVKTGKVVGMEALLRWNHPIKGKIPPMDFIPMAEQTGLIIEIGEWVIYEACKQNKYWQEQGYEHVVVSVNLSAVQLRQKNLIEKVKRILHETGLAPRYLELEITESMSMANEKNILAAINGFQDLGVNVSIDDFGTGYSSFKYLSLFPITKLKIDKMFMDDSQEQNQAIVKSIIHLSHALDMKVIAEGVETKEQFAFLEKEKCDEIQGFYFSKPLPPKELNHFLNRSDREEYGG